ncbi:MAG: hypothetical protein D6767_04980 [Candidatus Hydrogenedentota bacterium]|nr:MAG: hypothetical protein D6767_04980 [Candidatus Hydrogenedentota bacterium]
MRMKKVTTVLLGMFLVAGLYGAGVSESQAKIDVEDAGKAYSEISKHKDLKAFLPYREFYFAKAYLSLAKKYLDDSDYEKASYYAILSQTQSKSAIAIAQKRKLEYELLKKERDHYKKIVESDTTWVSVALLEGGLKRKGKKKFEGKFSATDAFSMPRNREPWRVEQVGELKDKFKKTLDKVYKVMSKQKKVKLIIETKSQRDRRTKDFSELYANKIQDYLTDKGIDSDRIKKEPKGRGPRNGEIILTLKGVDAK